MVTVFTLCYALSAPIFSTLLAGHSVRGILLIAISVFLLANVGSAFAHSFTQLMISRAIAGLGAGLFSPMAAAAAVSLVSPERKGRALGFILGGMGMGTVIGVPVGLLIAAHSQWHSVFLLVAALAFVALCGIFWRFPKLESKAPA